MRSIATSRLGWETQEVWSVECSSLAHVYGWMHQAVVMFVCVVCLCFVNSGPYDFDVLAGGCVV